MAVQGIKFTVKRFYAYWQEASCGEFNGWDDHLSKLSVEVTEANLQEYIKQDARSGEITERAILIK